MFDLFRSREKSVRILLGALLVLVAFSMLTYLVPSYNQGGSSASDNVIATVGGDTITLQEIQKTIQGTLKSRQMPPSQIATFIPQMVQEAVTDRALAYEAKQLGMEVSDEDLAITIRQTLPSLFPDGKFIGKDAYAGFLAQQDMTIPEFETDLKRQILIQRLRMVAVEGSVVTPGEVEAAYKKKNEKLKVQYVKLLNDKFKAEATPSAEEIQRYYQTSIARFTTPEKKNLVILLADQAKIGLTLTPTDNELLAMYNMNKQQFQSPERVQVVHILVNTQNKTPDEDAKLKAKAGDLLKQVRSGANVTDLVKKNSDDPGKAQNNGEYWVQQDSGMVPEFKAAAFRLKPGESDIVKTTYGYHVMKVLKKENAHLRTFDEAKADLTAQWRSQRTANVMQQVSDKAQGELQKDPTHPEKLAAQYGLQLIHADNVAAEGSFPEIGANADFSQSIAALKVGEVSQPVALPGNKLVLAVLAGIVAPRPQPFEEVKDTIKDTMTAGRMSRVSMEKATTLMAKAKSMGGNLEAAAKALGYEVKVSAEFGRTGTVEGIGTATYLEQGFRTADGGLLGPISLPDGQLVAKVVTHIAADMAQFEAERNKIRDDLKSEQARDRDQLFESGVRDALIKAGKLKVNTSVMQRLMQTYQIGG